jgi:hypothetical protein
VQQQIWKHSNELFGSLPLALHILFVVGRVDSGLREYDVGYVTPLFVCLASVLQGFTGLGDQGVVLRLAREDGVVVGFGLGPSGGEVIKVSLVGALPVWKQLCQQVALIVMCVHICNSPLVTRTSFADKMVSNTLTLFLEYGTRNRCIGQH